MTGGALLVLATIARAAGLCLDAAAVAGCARHIEGFVGYTFAASAEPGLAGDLHRADVCDGLKS